MAGGKIGDGIGLVGTKRIDGADWTRRIGLQEDGRALPLIIAKVGAVLRIAR